MHKAQGITADKIVVVFKGKDKQPGLTTVALSRVRAPEDMLIKNMPDDHFTDTEAVRRKKQLQNYEIARMIKDDFTR
jgi:hypothetical protein